MKPQLHPELELSDFEKLEKFSEEIENCICPEIIKGKKYNYIYENARLELDLIADKIRLQLNNL